ncbi:hypothetical protein ACHAWF_007877 [Thalassiosira exigua]
MFPSDSAEPARPLEFAIFNDGIPSSVFYGIHPEHEVVQHIPDEAIEELFPPNAEEVSSLATHSFGVRLSKVFIWSSNSSPQNLFSQVAEMEAAEEFVETMAWLSYLDECDEAARFNFVGCKKRWAARRKAGLVGKPHPPRERHHNHEDDEGLESVRSGTISSTSDTTTSLVPYVPRMFEVVPRKVDNRIHGTRSVPKNAWGARGGRRGLIQQPRKHY